METKAHDMFDLNAAAAASVLGTLEFRCNPLLISKSILRTQRPSQPAPSRPKRLEPLLARFLRVREGAVPGFRRQRLSAAAASAIDCSGRRHRDFVCVCSSEATRRWRFVLHHHHHHHRQHYRWKREPTPTDARRSPRSGVKLTRRAGLTIRG